MTDKNDLKPGDVVQHHRWGNGVVTATSYGKVVYYAQLDLGTACSSSDLTGWERAEIVKPGHVQVRVDDLWAIRHRLDRWANVDEVDIDPHGNNLPEHNAESTLLIRVTKAIHAATKPAQPDEPTEFGARVTLDGHRWLRSGVAPRPFVNRHGARASWEELCATARRATLAITLGWGDES